MQMFMFSQYSLTLRSQQNWFNESPDRNSLNIGNPFLLTYVLSSYPNNNLSGTFIKPLVWQNYMYCPTDPTRTLVDFRGDLIMYPITSLSYNQNTLAMFAGSFYLTASDMMYINSLA